MSELFSDREFDPFEDESGTISSIAQLAARPDLGKQQTGTRLRVLLPVDQITPQSQRRIEQALARYCSHHVAGTRLEMLAWRRTALRSFLLSTLFFAISLLITAGVNHAQFIPEEIQTLAGETLVIAGWVIMWQPMSDLIEGWQPIRDRRRGFEALGAMRVTVEPAAE